MKFLSCIGASLVLCAPLAQAAVVINDGTTAEGLVRLAPPPLAGSATTTLTAAPEGNLLAEVNQQEGLNFPILHTAWYATAYVATGVTFQASAEFVPNAPASFLEGGVAGWLNEEDSLGIVFALRNEPTRTYGQVELYDLSVGTRVPMTLFDTNGVEADPAFSQASESALTPGYVPENRLRLEVSFEPPTTNDVVVVPNATARLTAVGTQDNGAGDQAVTTPIVLLTTLSEPVSGEKLLAYYAVYRSTTDTNAHIGRLDNLTIDGEYDIGNQLPIITLTTPEAGQQFASGDPIDITANASDPDGTIAQVEFFAGIESLSIATQAPYTHQWESADIGVHSLSAVATDDRGASRTSEIVSIEVTNRPPVVSITTPTDGQIFPAGTGVVTEAVASDPDGSVAQVQFFLDDVFLSGSTVPPYATAWLATQEGTFTLTAVATDERGASTTSAPVTVRIGETSIEPAVMTVNISNGLVNVTWDRTGFQLQYAFSLLGPWTDVGQDTTGVTQYSEPVSGQPKYYRLVARGVTPSQPSLTIERSGADLTVTWDRTGFQLQYAFSLLGPWTDVGQDTTGVTQYSEPVSGQPKYYRLVARGVAPSQPSLTIERSGADLTVTWNQTGYQLQESTDLTASWQDVSTDTTGGTEYTAPISSPRNFFRLGP